MCGSFKADVAATLLKVDESYACEDGGSETVLKPEGSYFGPDEFATSALFRSTGKIQV